MIGINIVLLLLAIACDVKIELIPLLNGILDLIVPVFVSLTHVSLYTLKHFYCKSFNFTPPRWSRGQDSALSPPRPGFDSPSGKGSFLTRVQVRSS